MEAKINVKRKRVSNHPLADKIDDEQYFRYFYLPWIVMDVFYDYVDTICDQIMYLRVKPLKKLMHRIRWFQKDYMYLEMKHMDWQSRENKKKNADYLQDIFQKEFSTEYNLVRWQVSRERKLLEDDWRTFIASVYMAIIIFKGLKEFCVEVDRFLGKLKGGGIYHSIIPDMVPVTYDLVCECLGDCNVLSEEDIKLSCKRFVGWIKDVRFTDDPSHNKVNGKTIRERYLEEKGDLPKAPNGTTKKLMEEFGITSKKKYYNLIR